MVQMLPYTQQIGTPTDDPDGCLVAVSLTKDVRQTQRTSVRRRLRLCLQRNREGRIWVLGLRGSDLSTQRQRGAQRIIDARLPSVAAGTEHSDHIGIQPDCDHL